MATYIFPQTISLNEINPTYEAADPTGNTFTPGNRIFIHLKNDNPASVAASVTVTVDDPNTVAPSGGTSFNPDLTILLAAQDEALVGPVTASRFSQPSTGYAVVNYDDADEMLIAVFDLGAPGT